jgi:hypothetical protein
MTVLHDTLFIIEVATTTSSSTPCSGYRSSTTNYYYMFHATDYTYSTSHSSDTYSACGGTNNATSSTDEDAGPFRKVPLAGIVDTTIDTTISGYFKVSAPTLSSNSSVTVECSSAEAPSDWVTPPSDDYAVVRDSAFVALFTGTHFVCQTGGNYRVTVINH